MNTAITFSDIDECSLQLDSCNANEDCINTEGGFECMCEPGFTGVPGGCTGKHTVPNEIAC